MNSLNNLARISKIPETKEDITKTDTKNPSLVIPPINRGFYVGSRSILSNYSKIDDESDEEQYPINVSHNKTNFKKLKGRSKIYN